MRLFSCFLVVGVAGVLVGNSSAAERIQDPEPSDFSVLVLEPVGGRAVVRLPGGDLELVRDGERLPGSDLRVKRVLHDRLILERETGDPPLKRLVWLYRAESPSKRSRVEYLDLRFGSEKETESIAAVADR